MAGYFDMKIDMLDVGGPVEKDRETGAFCINGVHIGQMPQQVRLEGILRVYGRVPAAVLSITDNGEDGDGIWLNLHLTEERIDEKDLANIKMNLAQAKTFRAALDAVIRMRENESAVSEE